MPEVAIVSGKGGCGKTTLSASLAYVLKKRGVPITILDADVDAPDLQILFNGEYEDKTVIRASRMAKIDYDKCTNCGVCVDACQFDAIRYKDDGVTVYIDEPFCEGCGVCKLVCPVDAVSLEEYETGDVTIFKSNLGFRVVTGHVGPQAEASGMMVNEARKISRIAMIKDKSDLLLIDGPPGIGCPVISSVSGTDLVILITEPTPTGLHDLKRVYEIVKHFQIPAVLVINKADIHEPIKQKIIQWAKQNNIEIIGEIPLEDVVPRAIVQMKPVVEVFPESTFAKIMEDITNKFLEKLDEVLKNPVNPYEKYEIK